MTKPKRAVHDYLDVPLPAGRVLRLVLHREWGRRRLSGMGATR